MLLAMLCLAAIPYSAAAATVSKKPMLPVTVTIGPTMPGINADTLQPGEAVAFTVKATTLADASEMHLEAKLSDSIELISGTLEWAGPAGKGEEKQISFTVRVPLKGQGSIKATATIVREGKRTVKSTAQYVLGRDEREKQKPGYQLKKDSKGRDIIEY
jgi:hypothetical protein